MSFIPKSRPKGIRLVLAAAALGVAAMTASVAFKAPAQQARAEDKQTVLAVVNGDEITRNEVLATMGTTPPYLRTQMSPEQLFTVILEQMINQKLVDNVSRKEVADSDPELKKQLKAAKQQIQSDLYLKRAVDERMTDEKLKAKYEELLPQIKERIDGKEEIHARHIIVDDEEKAKEIIKKLNDGGDFQELAKMESTDGTAKNGGDLGYFPEGVMDEDFTKAAFKLEPGEYTKKPVKTQFGYHVILLEDKRALEPPTFDEMKPQIKAQLQPEIVDELLQSLRKKAEIKRFSLDGKPLDAEDGDAEESN